MMSLEAFKEVLEQSGFPVAYHSFPEKEVPPMPYITYITPYSRNFKADGKVYSSSTHIQVELYTQVKDIEAEAKVEQVLGEFYFSKTETGIEDENCYEVIYELEV
jgi:hypothetical protein